VAGGRRKKTGGGEAEPPARAGQTCEGEENPSGEALASSTAGAAVREAMMIIQLHVLSFARGKLP
jgi:hypothetical protein